MPLVTEAANRGERRAFSRALVASYRRIARVQAAAAGSDVEIQAADLEEMLKEHDACGVRGWM
jgi:hypothetical protein